MTNDNFEFIVIKKTYTFAECSSCEGSGTKKRTFRKMVFVEDCPDCNGEGRKRFEKKEEFPLSEALKIIEKEKLPDVIVQVSDLTQDKSNLNNQSIV